MLIGDSITDGVGSMNGLGFRAEFHWRLQEMGLPAQLVGSEGDAPYRGCFRAGAHIADFYTGPGGNGSLDVAGQMTAYKPHAVSIHLGSNDVTSLLPMGPYQYEGATHFESGTISGQMALLLAYLARWATGENGYCLRRIYLSRIIPRPGYSEKLDALIAEYETIVTDANNGEIPGIPPGLLELVDQKTPFYTVTMLGEDQIHPNDTGYAQMAGIYAEAMKSLPMHLRVEGDMAFTGVMGQTLTAGPRVKVTNLRGEAQGSVIVEYSVLSGDVLLPDPPRALTDAEGVAMLPIQLGAMGSSEIQARVEGLKDSVVTFTVTAERGLEVAGRVESATDGTPVPGAEIYWRQGARFIGTTGSDGAFGFAGFMSGARVSLEARASRLLPGNTAIQCHDAALAAQYALGIVQPTQEATLLSDVDGDSRVSLRDAALIARYAVGVNDAVNVSGHWRFSPDSLVYAPLLSDAQDALWQGRVMGDIDGSWDAGSSGKAMGMGRISLEVAEGQASTVHLSCEDPLLSVQGVIRVNHVRSIAPQLYGAMAAGTVLIQPLEPGRWRFGYYHPLSLAGGMAFALEGMPAGESTIVIESLFVNGRRQGDMMLQLEGAAPDTWALGPNYPNPFNGETVIVVRMPHSASLEMKIYDLRGRLVRRLLKESAGPGEVRVLWDGRGESGQILASGVYLAVLNTGNKTMTLKMQMLK